MHILIVEDEPMLASSLAAHVESEGFTVERASTLRAASEAVAVGEYDCILLDLGLPDGDGLALLDDIAKQEWDSAVIILTARGDVEHRIAGLNRGADDYIAKPFSLLELTARIHAVLRRRFKVGQELTLNGMTIDLAGQTVTVAGRDVALTRNEFNILRYLAVNRNHIVTRIALAEHIWGNKVDDRFSLDFLNSHIKNIRRKLAEAGAADCIRTVYGVGYRCEDT